MSDYLHNGGDPLEERQRELADCTCDLCTGRVGMTSSVGLTIEGEGFLVHRACYEAPAREVVEGRLRRIAQQRRAARDERKLWMESAVSGAAVAEVLRLKGELIKLRDHVGEDGVSAPWLRGRIDAILNPDPRDRRKAGMLRDANALLRAQARTMPIDPRASFEVRDGAVRDIKPGNEPTQAEHAFPDEVWHGVDPANPPPMPADVPMLADRDRGEVLSREQWAAAVREGVERKRNGGS